jgi:thiol-disulfide isomerase/thioredoxin
MRGKGFALLALLLCFGASAQMTPGATPPDALGTSTDGHVVSLASLRGKVVVISFWATWCGYCMKEMPVLAGLQELAVQRHLPLQVVSVDYREEHRTFARSASMIHKALPSLMLSWDRSGAVGKAYGAGRGIPVMVMLHRDGTVAHIHVGYGEDMLDSLVDEINALLREPAPTTTVAQVN